MLTFVRKQDQSHTVVNGIAYKAASTPALCKALLEAGVAEETTPVRCYADTGEIVWKYDYPVAHFLPKAEATPVASSKGRGSWFSRLSSNEQGAIRADLEVWNAEGLSTSQMADKLQVYGVNVSMASVHKVLGEIGIGYNRQRG